MESKREIRKKRTLGYFVDAACQVIEKEGIQYLSVRKVADIAGYHYATLYSYFKDIHELKYYVALKFMDDIFEYIARFTKDVVFETPLDRFQQIRKAIAYYAFEHKDAFRLINFTYFGKNTPNVISKLMESKTTRLESQAFQKAAEFCGIPKKRADLLNVVIRSIFHSYFIGFSENRFKKDKDEVVKIYMSDIKELFDIFKETPDK
ncbi:TetR/AcrR family transcriptional regulator [candidate division WOR-3 bacterium]|nr:TetR/AcrR family transcriptional regulator [candidate division WOR-3 bacterium]